LSLKFESHIVQALSINGKDYVRILLKHRNDNTFDRNLEGNHVVFPQEIDIDDDKLTSIHRG
jgi:hypothetical protein